MPWKADAASCPDCPWQTLLLSLTVCSASHVRRW